MNFRGEPWRFFFALRTQSARLLTLPNDGLASGDAPARGVARSEAQQATSYRAGEFGEGKPQAPHDLRIMANGLSRVPRPAKTFSLDSLLL